MAWYMIIFQKIIVSHCVNKWKFLDSQSENQITITQLQGSRLSIKKNYHINLDRFDNSVRKYQDYKDSDEIPKYLHLISYHLTLYSED